MNPYSHIVVASKLETLVNPESYEEYYWGAIAPDIRYLAGIKRQQTHLPAKRIIDFISQHPHLKPFLQGYLVHCLCDEIDLGQVFFQYFPFTILKGKMSRQQIAVILEVYYFENERVNKPLSSLHNEVLSELGISETLSTKLSQSISQYATSLTFESRITNLAQFLGLENDSWVGKYMKAAISFQKNRLLKNSLFHAIRKAKISEQIVSMVASLYQQCGA